MERSKSVGSEERVHDEFDMRPSHSWRSFGGNVSIVMSYGVCVREELGRATTGDKCPRRSLFQSLMVWAEAHKILHFARKIVLCEVFGVL